VENSKSEWSNYLCKLLLENQGNSLDACRRRPGVRVAVINSRDRLDIHGDVHCDREIVVSRILAVYLIAQSRSLICPSTFPVPLAGRHRLFAAIISAFLRVARSWLTGQKRVGRTPSLTWAFGAQACSKKAVLRWAGVYPLFILTQLDMVLPRSRTTL